MNHLRENFKLVVHIEGELCVLESITLLEVEQEEARISFDWDEVKTDKDRECYLGHSVMAPVGRWQKGKDLSWYTKKSKTSEYKAILEAERAEVKQAEEEAMAAALGLKPSVKSQQPLSKQEVAEVFRRQSQTDDADGEERIKGVGFRGKSLSRARADSTSHNLTSIFEHDTSQDVAGSASQDTVQETADITSSSTNSRKELRAKLKAYLEKKAALGKSKKKKVKKEKRSLKNKHRRRTPSTSSSDSSEEEWVEAGGRARQSSDVRCDKHPGIQTHRQTKGDCLHKDTSRHYSKHCVDNHSRLETRSCDHNPRKTDRGTYRASDNSFSDSSDRERQTKGNGLHKATSRYYSKHCVDKRSPSRSYEHNRRQRDIDAHRDNSFNDSSDRKRTSKSRSGRDKSDHYDLSPRTKRRRGS